MDAHLSRARGATVAIAAAAMLLAAPVGPAGADQTSWNDGPLQRGFNVSHVPDLDQRRTDLANNGACYCVPTASINWMAYYANHGWMEIGPGPYVWTDPTTYGVATFAIDLLGSEMAIDPSAGTSGGGTMNGLKFWLRDLPFTAEGQWPTSTWSPTFETVLARAMDGAVVMIAVGWYSENGSGELERNGGHMVSVVFGERTGADRFIAFRDPWTDDSMTAQAPFSTELHRVQNVTATPTYGSARTMSRVVGYGNAYIDWVVSIEPIFLLAYLPEPRTLIVHYQQPPEGWLLPNVREFPLPVETSVRTMTRRADGKLLYLTEPDDEAGRVHRLDMLSGGVDELEMPLTWPTDMLQGRKGQVYFVDEPEIVMYDMDAPGGPVEVASVMPGPPVTAMDFDDPNDRLVVLSQAAGELLFFPGGFDNEPEIWDVPPSVPLEAGVSAFCWNDADQSAWIGTWESPQLWRVWFDPFAGLAAQAIVHPDVVEPPTAVTAVNYYGRVYIASAGAVHELIEDQQTGAWEPPPNPFFGEASVVGAGPVVIPPGGTTWDASWQVGPQWEHVLPTSSEPLSRTYDCPTDVDGNRVVNVDDLIAVILAWEQEGYPGFIPSDTYADGVVNVDDLLTVILAWGDCP